MQDVSYQLLNPTIPVQDEITMNIQVALAAHIAGKCSLIDGDIAALPGSSASPTVSKKRKGKKGVLISLRKPIWCTFGH